ncbi:MAG: hypothetical protein Ct9H90mP27_6840 [Gammaproteobacteria bacterium]|nr:MAG: hypothetical protein Ct9H90mP27_6840 [Gammaproteobacteria bacterium]
MPIGTLPGSCQKLPVEDIHFHPVNQVDSSGFGKYRLVLYECEIEGEES